MFNRVSLPWRGRSLQMAAAAILGACGGGDIVLVSFNTNGTASGLVIQVCSFTRVEVSVDQVRITQAGGGEITVALPQPRDIDLLDPGTGVLETLHVPPLTRDAVDVRLRVAGGSTVRLEDGTVAALRVPAELRLVGDFRLAAGMTADIVIRGFDRCGAIQGSPSGPFTMKDSEVPAFVSALASGT